MESANNLKKLGDDAYVQVRYEEAIQSYNLAIEKNNADDQGNLDIITQSALHSNRCMCYIKLNKIPEAWQDAQAALALRPRWAKAHLRCAQCHELQGALEEAIAHYQRAAELNSSLAEEIVEPIKNLQAKLAQQHCHAVMFPPPPTKPSPPPLSSSNAKNLKRSPIYYASLCPQAIKFGSKTTDILAAAYGDGALRLWCTATGSLLQTLQDAHSEAVTTLCWSPDGLFLASGSLDMTCAVWKLEESSEFKLVSVLKGHSGRVSAVKFAPLVTEKNEKEETDDCTSQLVITASTDLSIKIWKFSDSVSSNRSDAECLYTLGGHSSLVSDIDIDPLYNKILVSASGDAQFKLWDLENKGQLIENVAWESGPVVLCGFLPPSLPLLLTAHAQLARQEGRILLWDLLDKKDGWVDGNLAAPAWALDGFVGRPTSWDACCRIRCIKEHDPSFTDEKEQNEEKENSILLAVACSDATVRVWQLVNQKTRPLELFGFELAKHTSRSTKFGNNAIFNLPPWHAAALAQQQTAGNSFKIKFSPQGRFLAATCGDANQVVSIWSIHNGEEVRTFGGHSARIRSLEWSKDGKYLFSASEDGAVRKWLL